MVAICASCNDLYAWAALFIGIAAGLAYIAWHHLVLYIRVDDPIDAVAGKNFVPEHFLHKKHIIDRAVSSRNLETRFCGSRKSRVVS